MNLVKPALVCHWYAVGKTKIYKYQVCIIMGNCKGGITVVSCHFDFCIKILVLESII